MFSQSFSPAFARVTRQDEVEKLITAEQQSLSPSALVALYELDLSTIDGTDIFRFHNGVSEVMQPVVWAGNEYYPMPITAEGYEVSSQGTLPKPKMTIANTDGLLSAIVRNYKDLIGCKVTRIRTYARYLDAVNFSEGNELADSTAELPRDIYFVNRKVSEDKKVIQFELAPLMEVQGIMIPRRQVIGDLCLFKYRDPDSCRYTGPGFDRDNNPTSNPALDRCNHKVSGCFCRHPNSPMPFGNFPGASLGRS